MTPTPEPRTLDRTELRRLAEAATPGPWTHGWSDGSGRWTAFTEGATIAADFEFESPGVVVGGRDSWGVPFGVIRESDAEYIAAVSPDVVLALLDEIEAHS